ncbi:hypothetical protein ACHQM5_003277 [Ranunculus cassubicifolius]
MAFSANPLSLSVPEPAFETWLRDSGYLEILDDQNTNLHHQPPPPSTTSTESPILITPVIKKTTASRFSFLKTLISLCTINPFAKLTIDDFGLETPSWTVGFIGFVDSYSLPSSPSQARLRVHENIKRYARNYAALFLLVFACTLYQLPVSLFGLIACLVLWEFFKWCSELWEWEKYPAVRLSLIRLVQCVSGLVLYSCGVQMALFCAMAITYAVMILHAAFRKLSPLKQTTQPDGSKWFRQNKHRS